MRRRAIAIAVLGVAMVFPAGIWLASRLCSIGYRSGHTMVEMRDGMVGYYSNPGYKGFAWLDQGRKEGLMVTGPAKVPPTPYTPYASNRYWTAIYLKMWHLCVLLGIPMTWLGVGWVVAMRRARGGHCFQCGYDLRGVPARTDGSVSCPECSAVDDDRRASPR